MLDDHTWARIEFLLALRRAAPEVMTNLRFRLVPAHTHLIPTNEKKRRLFLVDPDEHKVVLASLRPEIREWGREYRLSERYDSDDVPKQFGITLLQWMEPVILQSLLDWVRVDRDPPDWTFPDKFSVGAYMDFPEPFVFETDGWALFRETEIAFRERVEERLTVELDKYIKEQLANTVMRIGRKKYPYPPLPERRTRRHFDWLVDFQVSECSISKIARQVKVSRQAVTKGLNTAAEDVIGLHFRDWLRTPNGGGRPRRIR